MKILLIGCLTITGYAQGLRTGPVTQTTPKAFALFGQKPTVAQPQFKQNKAGEIILQSGISKNLLDPESFFPKVLMTDGVNAQMVRVATWNDLTDKQSRRELRTQFQGGGLTRLYRLMFIINFWKK